MDRWAKLSIVFAGTAFGAGADALLATYNSWYATIFKIAMTAAAAFAMFMRPTVRKSAAPQVSLPK
jgi:hypothetical protein